MYHQIFVTFNVNVDLVDLWQLLADRDADSGTDFNTNINTMPNIRVCPKALVM